MRFVVVDQSGAYIPCEGNILDYYRPKIDRALLAICFVCGRWRVVRGEWPHNDLTFCDCKITIQGNVIPGNAIIPGNCKLVF